jgi:hypothetical protein
MIRFIALLGLTLSLSAPVFAQGNTVQQPALGNAMPGNAMPEMAPEVGSDAVEEAPWQDVITGQLEAFRARDGAAALNFAAAGFKATYSDPDAFFAAIIGSGYQPLVESRSHSFGEFTRISDTVVGQVVNMVGPDQRLYQALYQLVLEPEGWRVAGVALQQEQGLGV